MIENVLLIKSLKVMKQIILILSIFISHSSIYAQSSLTKTKQLSSYALLDLGFHAKLLNLNTNNNTIFVKKEEVKKSPRSIEDILASSKTKLKVAEPTHHLIAGCFANKKNADQMLCDLINQGYPSKILGQNEEGLYMVSFESLSSKKIAEQKLRSLKASGISSWIKKY